MRYSERKRHVTDNKSFLKRHKKSVVKGGQVNLEDQKFIDFFRRSLRHLFSIIGPHACAPPGNEQQRIAWNFFQALRVHPDGAEVLRLEDIANGLIRELLIYKLRYELNLLERCEELRKLFDDTVGKIRLKVLHDSNGTRDLRSWLNVHFEGLAEPLELRDDPVDINFTHNMGFAKMNLYTFINDKEEIIELCFFKAEKPFPNVGESYKLMFIGYIREMFQKLREHVRFFKVFLLIDWLNGSEPAQT